jgi:hypothetical protein
MVEARMLEKTAEVTERILVGDKVDAKLATPPVEPLNIAGRESAGFAPDRFVSPVSERVFGVKLELVDLEIGELFDELQQRFDRWHSSSRNVEHDTAPGKVGPIADRQMGKSRSVFAKELAQRGDARMQAADFPEFDQHSRGIDFQEIAFRMIWRGVSANESY